MTDIDPLIREFRADQPGPEAAPAAVAEAARSARGPRRRMVRRRLLGGAAVTATIAGAAVFLVLALPRGDGDAPVAVPGAGYGVLAVVGVDQPGAGAASEEVTGRAAGIIRARADAQGLTGVEVTRTGPGRLSVLVPGTLGWERVILLTADPNLRVIDRTANPDPDIATGALLGPDDITGITLAGRTLRVGVRDRAVGPLADALDAGHRLELVGPLGDQDTTLAVIDTARSRTMSSAALLAVPPAGTAEGTAERIAQTLAGGGLVADLSVESVENVGSPPSGAVEVPRDVLWGLDAIGLDLPPLRPGSVRPVLDGTFNGRRVTQWEGTDAAGDPRGILVIADNGSFSAGCPAPEGTTAPFVCGWGSGPALAHAVGLLPASATRVQMRTATSTQEALVQGRRFVALVPRAEASGARIVALDAAGRRVAEEPLDFEPGLAAPGG